jgi:hypothetical protein
MVGARVRHRYVRITSVSNTLRAEEAKNNEGLTPMASLHGLTSLHGRPFQAMFGPSEREAGPSVGARAAFW